MDTRDVSDGAVVKLLWRLGSSAFAARISVRLLTPNGCALRASIVEFSRHTSRHRTIKMSKIAIVAVVVALGLSLSSPAAARDVQYQDLEPVANVVDIRGIWQKLGLPQLPQQFCHIGLAGWHCHNTTKQPWDPKSMVPAAKTPKMPTNATCIICPSNWTGSRGNLMEMLLDLPSYWLGTKQASSLPQGMYNMTQLAEQQATKATMKRDTPAPSPKLGAGPKVPASPKPATSPKPTSSAAAPRPVGSPKPVQSPKPAGSSPKPTASPKPQQSAASASPKPGASSPKPAAVRSSPKPAAAGPAAKAPASTGGGAKRPSTPAKPQQGGAKPAAAGLQIVTEELQPM